MLSLSFVLHFNVVTDFATLTDGAFMRPWLGLCSQERRLIFINCIKLLTLSYERNVVDAQSVRVDAVI